MPRFAARLPMPVRPSPPQPFGNMRFRLEIDRMVGSGAVEVVFPDARLIPSEKGKAVVEYGVLTIRRGVTGSPEWYEWWDAARASRATVTRSVRVLLLDGNGADALRWTFDAARPLTYMLSPLDALGSAPLIESLELAVAGFAAHYPLSPVTKRAAKRAR